MPKTILTDARPRSKDQTKISTIQTPTKDTFYTDAHPDAGRGLALRVTPAGSKFWTLRYSVDGRYHRKTLGEWPRMGPAAARVAANKLRAGIEDGHDPIPERWNEAKRKKREAERARKRVKAEQTLGALLEAYVAQLRREGKKSARAVECSVWRNVRDPFPALWNAPAADVDTDDLVEIIARLADEGKEREASKVRAYVRRAFALAKRARTKADMVPELRAFRLADNPAAEVEPLEGTIRPRERALSPDELRAYWKRLEALPDPEGALLRFHMLTGGQRLEQLFRLTPADLQDDGVVLLDPKGRRTQPRRHFVPLLDEAREALAAMSPDLRGPFLVSLDGGESKCTDHRLRGAVSRVAAAMLEAGEATERFTPGDLRRTVETRLAAAGVTGDVLAQLLSHGLGGIQWRHYQRHDFAREKRAALETLYGLLTNPKGDVVPMKREAQA